MSSAVRQTPEMPRESPSRRRAARPGASTVMRRTPPRLVRLTRVPVCSMMPVNMDTVYRDQRSEIERQWTVVRD